MNMEFLTRVTRQTEMKGRMMNGKNIYRKIFNDIRFEMSLCLSTKFYFPINISFILRTMNTSFCKVIKYLEIFESKLFGDYERYLHPYLTFL